MWSRLQRWWGRLLVRLGLRQAPSSTSSAQDYEDCAGVDPASRLEDLRAIRAERAALVADVKAAAQRRDARTQSDVPAPSLAEWCAADRQAAVDDLTPDKGRSLLGVSKFRPHSVESCLPRIWGSGRLDSASPSLERFLRKSANDVIDALPAEERIFDAASAHCGAREFIDESLVYAPDAVGIDVEEHIDEITRVPDDIRPAVDLPSCVGCWYAQLSEVPYVDRGDTRSRYMHMGPPEPEVHLIWMIGDRFIVQTRRNGGDWEPLRRDHPYSYIAGRLLKGASAYFVDALEGRWGYRVLQVHLAPEDAPCLPGGVVSKAVQPPYLCVIGVPVDPPWTPIRR